jgi:hypothetical protein
LPERLYKVSQASEKEGSRHGFGMKGKGLLSHLFPFPFPLQLLRTLMYGMPLSTIRLLSKQLRIIDSKEFKLYAPLVKKHFQ